MINGPLITRSYGDYFFLVGPWRAPSAPRAPRGRGACGVLATPLQSGTSLDMVFILSYLTFSGSLHPKFQFIFLRSFLWCTSRFRPWPISFHSLYNSSWLCHLQELNQIPPLSSMTPSYIYVSFTPSNSTSSLEILSDTFSNILSWMNSNKLLLNPSKTEFLLIGTKQQWLKFFQLTTLSLGNDIIPVSSSARNLGFIFDSDISFTDQINSLSKSCYFHIRDIRRIHHLLPLSAATALANSLVSSKLDYCNSFYILHSTYNGILQANWNKIQRIQNTLARVVTNTSKCEHITPILKHYIGFQSNNASITNYVFSHIKHFKFSNLPIFPIVHLFLLTLCLQDHLIHRFCPSHMSEHLWVKGLFLSLFQDSGTPSHQTPVIRLSLSTCRSKLKTHLFKLALPLEFSPILSMELLIWI